MPTKRQLYQTWATEHEFPETRREDDPAYRKPKIPPPMTNPPLPEEIREQINKQAKIMYNSLYAQTAYKHAATTYASLALALKDALEESQKTIEWMSNHMTVVLAKYAPIERSMVESSTIKTKAALGLFPEQGKEGKENG